MHDHLSSLDLADPSRDKNPLEIDALIGSDYYWDLAAGKILRGNDRPITIHTKLHWVLSGPAHLPWSHYNLQQA